MIKYYCCLIATLVVLASCHNNPNDVASKYLNTANLPEQTFSINTERDTTVSTKDGIKLFISAKAIAADGNVVTLVIKEAVTLDEMLKARLTTMSDKGLLASAGMFDIYTKENAAINKPIQVSMPAFYTDDKMKLYKGKETDGSIEWQDPEPITKTITTFSDMGKVLFDNNCTSCHGIDKSLTGSALAWIDKKKSKEWLRDFTRNNAAVRANCDVYANCIYNNYNKVNMTMFPNLSDSAIDAIYRYIDKVAKEKGVPESFNPNAECDSCAYYKAYLDSLYKVADSASGQTAVMGSFTVAEPSNAASASSYGNNSMETSAPIDHPDYYQFYISTFGMV